MRGRIKLLLLGFSGWSLNYVYRMMLPPLLPIMVADLGIRSFEAGMLMSAFFISYALMQVPAGLLSDIFSRKLIVFLCILLSSITTLLCGMVASYVQLLIVRLLFGFAAGFYYAPMISMLSDAYEVESRGRAVGFFMSGSRFGSAIAPVIAVYLAAHYGWRSSFTALSVPGILVSLAFLFSAIEPQRLKRSSIKGLSVLRCFHRPLILAYIIPAISLMSSMSLATFLSLYLVEVKHLSVMHAAFMASASSLMGFFGHLLGGFLTDKLGYKSALIVSMILASVSTLMLHYAPSELLAFSIFLFGLMSATGAAPIIAYTVECSPEEVKGLSLGIGNATGFIGASIGAFLGGFLIDNYGYGLYMLSISCLFLLAACLSLLIPEGKVLRQVAF